jgi:Transposase DDE domain
MCSRPWCYRLIDPGSEWRLHRQWYEQSAMGDLLGEDFGLVQIDKLYRCLDKLLPHKRDLFTYLRQRWQALFHVGFEVLLYDLTSTYFESEPPEGGMRKFGYSRDKRPDCVQVVIALVVTPEGFPLAYEIMPGNTLDKTTLADFLKRIEQQYGKAQRTWVMDRGIPTEETLSRMRTAETPIHYLVGTPRGRLSKLEKAFLTLPWEQVRDSVEVKLIEQAGELYILSRSGGRVHKERAMRRRRLKRLWKRLRELQQQKLTRDDLLLKLGAAKKEAGHAYRLVNLHLPAKDQPVTPQTFTFALNRNKLRIVRRREGSYLLRSNLTREHPARLWQYYIRDRAGLQRAQERSVHPPNLSPERRAYRSAHLCRFHGVLPSGNPQTPATRTGTGINPESGTGKVCGHTDGGCSPAYQRRALPHPTSLHTTRPGSAPPLVSDEIGTTSTVTPQDHFQRRPRGLTKA